MNHRIFIAAFFLCTFIPLSHAKSPELTVSVHPISAASLAQGATRVPMVKLTLTASCDADVTLRTITLHHAGLGAAADITHVYGMDMQTRITRSSTFQGKNPTAKLRFASLMIPACQSRSITIAADISKNAAAGSMHALEIRSPHDIKTNATVVLQKNSQTKALTTAPANIGLVTVSYLPLNGESVLFGKNRTLFRFSLKAESKDQFIDAVTVTNLGSARSGDLQNIFLSGSDGVPLTAIAPTLDGSAVRLIFLTPVTLSRNATKVVQLHAAVTASKRRTIRLSIEEPSDIEARTAR